jgi:uncharacterized protein
MNLDTLRDRCFEFLAGQPGADAAHDLSHVKRVLKNALQLSDKEQTDRQIIVPAACLHDCVSVAKDNPMRAQSSRLAADAAADFLAAIGYPAERVKEVHHAIEAHSFSAGIPVRTPEAAVVQDADRLDSLGAIGVARCLLVGGKLDRPLLAPDDPFCDERTPDDGLYTIDHFYTKLLKLPGTMQTAAGRAEAQRRADRMRRWLDELRDEVG